MIHFNDQIFKPFFLLDPLLIASPMGRPLLLQPVITHSVLLISFSLHTEVGKPLLLFL